jgi:hypothetical protein
MMTMCTLYSKTKEQHWEHLWVLFSILATNGLALNLEKCLFAFTKLNFLGHRTSTTCVAPSPGQCPGHFGFTYP